MYVNSMYWDTACKNIDNNNFNNNEKTTLKYILQ